MELPKQITQTLYICFSETWDAPRIYDMDMDTDGYTPLGSVEVTVDVPQVDITAKRIDALEAKRTEIVTEYQDKLNALDERIQELRALPAPGE